MLNTDAAQPAGRIATVHGHYTVAGEGYWRRGARKVGPREGGQAGTHPRGLSQEEGSGRYRRREIGNVSGTHTTARATAVGSPPSEFGCGRGPSTTGDLTGLSVLAREGHAGHAKEGWEGPA